MAQNFTKQIVDQKDARLPLCIVDSATSLAVGDGIIGFPIPAFYNGSNITGAIAIVDMKGITGQTDIQLRRRRAGVSTDVLSTKIILGDVFTAENGVINLANDDLATGDVLYCDIDAVHTTPPIGLYLIITITKP